MYDDTAPAYSAPNLSSMIDKIDQFCKQVNQDQYDPKYEEQANKMFQSFVKRTSAVESKMSDEEKNAAKQAYAQLDAVCRRFKMNAKLADSLGGAAEKIRRSGVSSSRHFIKKPVLASTQSNVVKFEVGQTYTSSGLYGGQITYKVVNRTGNTVSLAESHISEDDYSEVDDGVTEYPIVMQDMYDDDYKEVVGQQESVVIWEYSGHQGYLFARDSRIGEYEGEEVYAAKHVDTGIEIDFPGKKTFDTLEEAQAFKRTLGDRYRRTWKSEYPDCTLYTVDFKPEDSEEPEYYDEEDEEYDQEYMDAYEAYEEDVRRREYPSSTAGDYSPSNPWDAPGMHMRDFI